MSSYRDALLKLARLFAEWKLDRQILLSVFVRRSLLEDAGGFDWRDESVADKLSFLLGQMEESGDRAETTLEEQLVAFLEQIALFSPSERQAGGESGRAVLSTIHQSKGLEWKAVFVMQSSNVFVFDLICCFKTLRSCSAWTGSFLRSSRCSGGPTTKAVIATESRKREG